MSSSSTIRSYGGTTSRPIVELLRQNGAREVHMRVHSPPIRWPCYLGVDMATREELIAAHLSVEEIGRAIGADSIGYLSLEGLFRAIGLPRERFCAACLTGRYPVPVPPERLLRRRAMPLEDHPTSEKETATVAVVAARQC